MIRHHAFFETLGALEESDPAWNSVLGGLSVLRLVDWLVADKDAGNGDRPPVAGIDGVREIAGSIREGDPARAVLLRILDGLESPHAFSPDLARELMTYGKSLDLEGRWPLAADVFQSIADNFRSQRFSPIVIESLTALGAATRNTGDWSTSDRAYAEAQHLADLIGDRVLSLTAQTGIANSHVAHGNLPAAEAELAEVLDEAGTLGLLQVEALALHTKAYLAITAGDYQRAVHYGYRSLELTTNETARDRILGDLAAAYAGLGYREAARDGYSIVAVTSPHQWVRWQATLNLMELAIDDGAETQFDQYVAQVDGQPLGPRLQSYLLLLKARGFRRFERTGAEEFLAVAHREAAKHQLHQITFEVEAEMGVAAIRLPAKGLASTPSEDHSGELGRIAEALAHLREEITAT